MKSRDRAYQDMAAAERLDTDADGIPDVYQVDGHNRRDPAG